MYKGKETIPIKKAREFMNHLDEYDEEYLEDLELQAMTIIKSYLNHLHDEPDDPAIDIGEDEVDQYLRGSGFGEGEKPDIVDLSLDLKDDEDLVQRYKDTDIDTLF